MSEKEQSDWTLCADELPPDGELVDTKIDDDNGVRNEQLLVRRGRLWWINNSVHTYYEPTHWRRP